MKNIDKRAEIWYFKFEKRNETEKRKTKMDKKIKILNIVRVLILVVPSVVLAVVRNGQISSETYMTLWLVFLGLIVITEPIIFALIYRMKHRD